jgi:anti-sigma regulatory factor (Ser/Thr protein kinase)
VTWGSAVAQWATSGVPRRRFPPTAEAVRDARRYTRAALDGRATETVVQHVELVVSELATNAVVHGGSPFELAVEVDGRVRVEVLDHSPDLPAKRAMSATATSGRGLHIVEALCDRWGVELAGGGKRVWCEKDLR